MGIEGGPGPRPEKKDGGSPTGHPSYFQALIEETRAMLSLSPDSSEGRVEAGLHKFRARIAAHNLIVTVTDPEQVGRNLTMIAREQGDSRLAMEVYKAIREALDFQCGLDSSETRELLGLPRKGRIFPPAPRSR